MSIFKNVARVLCDIFFFAAVIYVIIAINKWYDPYKRGFFCDDESLKYPFQENTFGIWELVYILLIVPAIIIIAVESLKQFKSNDKNNIRLVQRLKNCYKHLGYYFFGFAMIWLATLLAKYGVGRLRPHFFAVCSPQMPDGTTCADLNNFGRYITNYTCVGPHATEKLVLEIKRSFPSGHTSFVFYTVVYMCLYLQVTLSKNFSKLFKHFVQLSLMMFALYVALTRITDYWHHWTDVLAGSLMGTFFGIFAAIWVADSLDKTKFGYIKMTQLVKKFKREMPMFVVEKMPLSSESDATWADV